MGLDFDVNYLCDFTWTRALWPKIKNDSFNSVQWIYYSSPPTKTNNSFSANPHQSSFPRFNQADSVSTCTRQQLDNVEGTLVQSASLMTEALWGSHAKGVSSLCLKGSRGMETVQEYRNYTGISGTEIFRFYWCASLKYAYISRVIKFN